MLMLNVLRKLTIIVLMLSTFTTHTMKRALKKSEDVSIEQPIHQNTVSYFDMLPYEVLIQIVAHCYPKEKNVLMRTNHYLNYCASKENYKLILHQSPVLLYLNDQAHWLIVCIQENEIKIFKNLLLNDTSPNIPLYGLLLSSAITKKRTNIARLLIEETDVDVNKRYVEDYTPLQRATQEGCTEIVQSLLKHTKINTTIPFKMGYTLCHIASEHGHTAIMKLLIDHDETLLNKACTEGATPLYIAAQNNKTEVIELLLTYKGINTNSRFRRGFTPIYVAAYFGHHEVVKLLLNRQDILINSSDDNDGNTALFVAAQNGHKKVIALLLANPEIKVNIPYYGKTPIHQAVSSGHTEIVKLFIAYDGNLVHMRTTKNAFTPLHMACEAGQFDAASALLQAQSININALDNDNKTPLDLALKNNHAQITELLISKGAMQGKNIREQT